jgi:hypothetical protein
MISRFYEDMKKYIQFRAKGVVLFEYLKATLNPALLHIEKGSLGR